MDLLYKNKVNKGLTEIIFEEVNELEYITFSLLNLMKNESFSAKTGDYEVALVILGGSCSIETAEKKWLGIGERLNVFDGRATAVYIPCNSSYKIIAESSLEIAICGARADEKMEPQLITPDEVKVNKRGKLNWKRDVHDIISKNNTKAQRLLIGETFNRPGNWSSYPPHKHDIDNLPEEVNLEEVYHFRINPNNGFGIQRIYTDDNSINETYVINNKDTVVLPEGYHPVAAAPGYQVYYLWILAGKSRVMRPRDDSKHKWIKAVEKMIDN